MPAGSAHTLRQTHKHGNKSFLRKWYLSSIQKQYGLSWHRAGMLKCSTDTTHLFLSIVHPHTVLCQYPIPMLPLPLSQIVAVISPSCWVLRAIMWSTCNHRGARQGLQESICDPAPSEPDSHTGTLTSLTGRLYVCLRLVKHFGLDYYEVNYHERHYGIDDSLFGILPLSATLLAKKFSLVWQWGVALRSFLHLYTKTPVLVTGKWQDKLT